MFVIGTQLPVHCFRESYYFVVFVILFIYYVNRYGERSEDIMKLFEAKDVVIYKLNLNFEAFKKTYPFLCTYKSIKSLEEKNQNIKVR